MVVRESRPACATCFSRWVTLSTDPGPGLQSISVKPAAIKPESASRRARASSPSALSSSSSPHEADKVINSKMLLPFTSVSPLRIRSSASNSRASETTAWHGRACSPSTFTILARCTWPPPFVVEVLSWPTKLPRTGLRRPTSLSASPTSPPSCWSFGQSVGSQPHG